jgi:hypothetical protein
VFAFTMFWDHQIWQMNLLTSVFVAGGLRILRAEHDAMRS